jgi:hypothetical protein
MNLQPHQQRVVNEKQELDKNLDKLTAFINSNNFTTVDQDERRRLVKQESIMREYSDVSAERIEAFIINIK